MPRHTPTYVPTAQPKRSLPEGISMVVNLRGNKTPPYRVPETTEYLPLFMRGGPNAWASASFIDMILRRIGDHPGGRVLIHCQHGLNRTGLVWCALSIRDGRSRTVKEAMEKFASVRSKIERPWVARALRNWVRKSRHLRKQRNGKHGTGLLHHRSAQGAGRDTHPVAPTVGGNVQSPPRSVSGHG